MDKTEKFFYLPQATNASFVPSPSDGPSCLLYTSDAADEL